MILPKLYAVVDAEVLRRCGVGLREFAGELLAGGVRLVQYRNKIGSAQAMLGDAAVLKEVFAGTGAVLIFNDRADFAVLAGFDGVHVGQGDLSAEDAKRVLVGLKPHPSQGREGWGTQDGGIVGVSTHTVAEVRAAELSSADYVAVGPVFATGTKRDAAAVVGLEGVRAARALTGKPLVAIGGITLGNARGVIEAGADSVAVISGLFVEGRTVAEVARDFLLGLG